MDSGAASSQAVHTFCFNELRTYQPPIEDNNLISDGILKNNSLLTILGVAKSFKSFVGNTLVTDLVTTRNLFATTRSNKGRHAPAFTISKPCRVLMIEQEIGEVDLRDRLVPVYNSLSPEHKALMDANLYTHSLDHRIQLDNNDGIIRLINVVEKIRPDVLFLDPLIEFHTSNENDTQSMNMIMRQFDWLREKYAPMAIIFSHHEGHKNMNNRQGIDRFRGNTVIGGKVDGAILISVHNRRALKLRLDFVLRRGKPLDSLYLQLDDNLQGQFICWQRDPDRKRKIGRAEEEENSPESFLESVM